MYPGTCTGTVEPYRIRIKSDLVSKGKAGGPQLLVKFSMDAGGVLHVEAIETGSGKGGSGEKALLQTNAGVSNDAIDELKRYLVSQQSHDEL